MSPQRPNLVLTTNVPHVKLGVLVRYRLYVETNGRDGSNVLVELELVKNGCKVMCQLIMRSNFLLPP